MNVESIGTRAISLYQWSNLKIFLALLKGLDYTRRENEKKISRKATMEKEKKLTVEVGHF